MPKSLQEQLLSAGVANKKQAAKAKKAQKQKIKQRKSGVVVEDETAKKLQEEQLAKAERDRELNRQRDAAAEKKAIHAQIKQIIAHSKINRTQDAERQFNFTDGSHVKYIQVTEDQQAHLSKGYLAIVRDGESYELIPASAAKKISSRAADLIVAWNEKTATEKAAEADADDPYAEYEIPDDLMW